MKAIISSTYTDIYLWNLPIVTWCWNRLGVDVICFMPYSRDPMNCPNGDLVLKTIQDNGLKCQFQWFWAAPHKEATYAQCSRLYGACLDLPEDEVLITSDVDMAVFQIPANVSGTFSVYGYDLVPEGQMPMCYLTASVKQWRETFGLDGKSYQQCLDEILGHEEMENMRGNLWSRDQEIAYDKITNRFSHTAIKRARSGTQFAENRYDRDDAFILDRLSPDTIDFHMPRPGYEPQNFEIIMKILKYHYPNDNFDWLGSYNERYKQLL
jgi:hypothetical protein